MEAAPPTTEEQVRKQVEFYFGDSNFRRDKFLRAQAALDAEGYVLLSVLNTFARLKAFGLSEDKLAAILRNSEVLQVNEEGSKVKRKFPLSETDDSVKRSIYTKGWPIEGLTIEFVSNSLKSLGNISAVRLRKKEDKTLKGSAFVEFATQEEATEAAKNEKLQLKDFEITISSKEAWWAAKKEEKNEKKKKKANGGGSGSANTSKKRERDGYTAGLIIKVNNFGSGLTRDDWKNLFSEYGTVNFVECKEGEETAYLRMVNPESAKNAVNGFAESGKEIGGKVPQLSILEGEEEKSYWDKIISFQSKKRKGGKKKRRF